MANKSTNQFLSLPNKPSHISPSPPFSHSKQFSSPKLAFCSLTKKIQKQQKPVEMAVKGVDMVLVLFSVLTLWNGAAAQSGCTRALISLSSCLNYVNGNSSSPSSSCCLQLSNIVQSQPRCLCSLLNGGGASLGVTVNQTLALALPGACSVQTPPVSQCNGKAKLTSLLSIAPKVGIIFRFSNRCFRSSSITLKTCFNHHGGLKILKTAHFSMKYISEDVFGINK